MMYVYIGIAAGIAALGWVVFLLAAAGSTDVTSRPSGKP